MKKPHLSRVAGALAALLLYAANALAAEATAGRHSLCSLRGKSNTVYLLVSVHFLSKSEPLPAVVDQAYADAEALVMEIDMDDLDPTEMQQAALEHLRLRRRPRRCLGARAGRLLGRREDLAR